MLQPLTRLAQALALAFALVCPARADELDDKYLRILNTVDQAEALEKAGKTDAARAKYQTVQKSLLEIKKADPTWKVNMVAHRLAEVEAKLAGVAPAAETPTVPPASGAPKTAVAPSTGGSSVRPVVAGAPTGVTLKLLSAGVAPQRALRLQPKAGDQQKLEMTMNIAMEMSMGGAPVPAMNIPAIKFPLDLAVEGVAADGDISFTKTMGEPTLAGSDSGALGEAMLAQFSSLKGQSARSVMTSRGVIKSAEAKAAPGDSPQTQQSLEQIKDALAGISVTFPEEAIGPGAKWEVKQVLKSQGMTINQTGVFELVAVTGDRADIKLTIVQSAPAQKIASPMMPGMKIDLEKLEGSGTGRAVYDLTRLLPVSGDVDSSTDIKMGMDVAGQKQAMSMKTTTKLQLESK